MQTETRCAWAQTEHDIAYHDKEWGMPQHDDHILFEFLILEGMQAGLSWNLILRKREAMREAFSGFDAEKVARYGQAEKDVLLQNPGIIRNRAKINALVGNAQAFLQAQEEFGSFDAYIWGFVDGKPICNNWSEASQMPATSAVSDAMSKALRKRGFRFVGSTICYSYMQAVGMVNDHVVSCPQHALCKAAAQEDMRRRGLAE